MTVLNMHLATRHAHQLGYRHLDPRHSRVRRTLTMAAARRMATLLSAFMLVQSVLGLVWSDQYRDVDWIRATWYGNDWITLVAAVPLLWFGRLRAARGSVRGLLLVLGLAGYAVYNYAFYLFGA